MQPILISWSGGKDSALALWELLRSERWHPLALLCSISQPYGRVTMHGVRLSLLERQARALGLPLVPIYLPPEASNSIYEARWAEALEPWRQRGVRHVAFGDIFLRDIRAYRENQLAALDMEPIFPIWTGLEDPDSGWALLERFWQTGFHARIVCADSRYFKPEWVGEELTPALLRALPEEVDPCGERGEFHTFVFSGPLFSGPIAHRLGRRVLRGGFYYRDLVPLTPHPSMEV
nr:MAG: ATPase [Bacteroidota bacterium]